MKSPSNREIQNILKQAAEQSTPPLWDRVESGLHENRYTYEIEVSPAARKAWWRRPIVALAASLFLVVAVSLTLLYPTLSPATSTPPGTVELSFKARSDVLGNVNYGLEGNRSESLRLIESRAELETSLMRIGLLINGETKPSVTVEVPPYPQKVEASLPYTEEYFKKHALLMLLYPWETGYDEKDVKSVVKTASTLTVTLSQSEPNPQGYAGLRQALFVEVGKDDVEGCDRFVFEVEASGEYPAETLETARYRVESVGVNTKNAAANRILTDVQGIADLRSRLPDAAAREMLERYDEAYFQEHDLITLYLAQPYTDSVLDIVGVTSLKNSTDRALDIVLTKKNADTGGTNGRIYCLELPKGIVSSDTVLYLYNAFQGSVTILADLDEDDMTALELVQGEERTLLNINGETFMDFGTEPMMYGGVYLRPADLDGDGAKEMLLETSWTLPKGMRPYTLKRTDGEWFEITTSLFSSPDLNSWITPDLRLVCTRLTDGREHIIDITGHDDWLYENGELAINSLCTSGAYERYPAIVTLPNGQTGLSLQQIIYAVDEQANRYKLASLETILTMGTDNWTIYSEELKPIQN